MRRLLLFVPIVLLPLAGCGSDDGLTKDEFIAQGDALCREFEEDTGELEEPETVEELTDLLEIATNRTQEFHDDVAALDPPSGEGEEVHEAFLEAIDETVTKLEASLEAARAEDVERSGARFDEAAQAAMSVDAELRSYGFEDCANGDGSG